MTRYLRGCRALDEIRIHPRISDRHPGITQDDVLAAWKNTIRCQRRVGIEINHYAAIGVDRKGRLLEMVAAKTADRAWVVFHAMKASQKMFDELGMKDERKGKR
jgi:hypothetical protein